jgi:hypothetical protein
MRLFPSQGERHRRERRFLRSFFLVMGVLAALFALLILVRVVMERVP